MDILQPAQHLLIGPPTLINGCTNSRQVGLQELPRPLSSVSSDRHWSANPSRGYRTSSPNGMTNGLLPVSQLSGLDEISPFSMPFNLRDLRFESRLGGDAHPARPERRMLVSSFRPKPGSWTIIPMSRSIRTHCEPLSKVPCHIHDWICGASLSLWFGFHRAYISLTP